MVHCVNEWNLKRKDEWNSKRKEQYDKMYVPIQSQSPPPLHYWNFKLNKY